LSQQMICQNSSFTGFAFILCPPLLIKYDDIDRLALLIQIISPSLLL